MYSYTCRRLMGLDVSCASTHIHQQKLQISEIYLSATYTSNPTLIQTNNYDHRSLIMTFLSKFSVSNRLQLPQIRTHNPSKRAAAVLRLRPHSHWNRHPQAVEDQNYNCDISCEVRLSS